MERQLERLRFPITDNERSVFSESRKCVKPVQVANAQASDLVQPNLAAMFHLESIVLFPLIARGEMVGARGGPGRERTSFQRGRNSGALWHCESGCRRHRTGTAGRTGTVEEKVGL